MTCDEMGEILQGIIDGEADAETTKLAREHMSKCSRCAREYEGLSAMAGKLRQAMKMSDGEKMRRAVLSDPALRGRMSRRPLRLWFEAAALVALVFGVIWLTYIPNAKDKQVASPPKAQNANENSGASQSALFPRKLTLTPIFSGAKSGIADARQMVIKDYTQWNILAGEFSATGVNVPETDLNSKTVLALFSGTLTPRAEDKYLAPRFVALLETPERIEAHFAYFETSLPEADQAQEGSLTPFVMCSISKTDKPVIFIQERK